jgi:preprotein translocase subunit SecY
VIRPGLAFTVMTILSLTAGTAFIMWLGEQLTERGIGNGMSLIIMGGIVADIPRHAMTTVQMAQAETLKPLTLLAIGGVMVLMIALVVFFERAQRRIPVQYSKRVVGRKMYGGQSTHLPLRVNTSNVIPPIFASSLLLFPATAAGFFPDSTIMQQTQGFLSPQELGYNVVYGVLIIFFTFFYTSVIFNPVDVADNMKKFGGYIPGIRPGKKTAEYIDRVLTRITFAGAVYISAVCIVPTLFVKQFNVPFQFGGTALLIVVGVALDTVQQIESHLITRHYAGFTGPKGPRIRGRRSA